MSSPYAAPPPYPQQFPGGHPGPHQAPLSPALAIVSLITGILSVVLVPVIGLLALGLGVAGIVTGAIALGKRRPGRGMAIAGLVTGGVGALVSIVLTVVFVAVYGSFVLLGISGAFDDDQAPGEDDYGYADPGDSAGEYAYGESAELTDYVVSVDAVHLEGDVLYADVSAQYTGTDTGSAYYDLYGYVYDADGDMYDATDCVAPVSPDASALPDVAPGQTVTFQMCFEGIEDATGVWVEVDDDHGWADWTDDVTLGGSSSTGV